jgi:hypothetical protein
MKSTIDYSGIVKLSGVDEIEQLVTIYYIKYYRAPKDLKVEILQSLKDGMFTGKCNYAFWGPDQFDPYRDSHSYPSVEQALHFSINGFRQNDKPDYPNDLVFWRSDNGTYFDGNGKQVTIKEIQERRNRLKH